MFQPARSRIDLTPRAFARHFARLAWLLAALFLLAPLWAQACTCHGSKMQDLVSAMPVVAHVVVLSRNSDGFVRVRVVSPLRGAREGEEFEVGMGLHLMCGEHGFHVAPAGAEWLMTAVLPTDEQTPKERDGRRIVGILPCGETAMPIQASLKGEPLREYLFPEQKTGKVWQPFSWAFDVSSAVVHAKLARQQEVPNGVIVEVLTPLKNAQAGERLTILGRGLHGGPVGLECLRDLHDIFDAQGERSMVLALSEVQGRLPSRRYFVLNKCGDYALPVYRDQVLLNPDGQKPEKVELEKFLRAYR